MICTRCNGYGYDECYDEDGRYQNYPCYHCGTTGKIDFLTNFNDRLYQVALNIAESKESAYRRARNSEDFEEDYAFCAAENMLSAYDYFTERVLAAADKNVIVINDMSIQDQLLLIALNENSDSIFSEYSSN